MKVTTCTDQAECQMVLETLGCAEEFKPAPPLTTCDGCIKIADDCYVVGTNDNGKFTLHMLERANQHEAMDFMANLPSPKQKHVNYRLLTPDTQPVKN